MKPQYLASLVALTAVTSAGIALSVWNFLQPSDHVWTAMRTCGTRTEKLDIAKVNFTDVSHDTPDGTVLVYTYKSGNGSAEKPYELNPQEPKHSTNLDFLSKKYLKKIGDFMQIELTIPSNYKFPDKYSVEVDSVDGYKMFCRTENPISVDKRTFTFYIEYVPNPIRGTRIGAYSISIDPVISGIDSGALNAGIEVKSPSRVGPVLRRQVDPNVKNSG